jgi:hypothetical protein
MADDEIEFWLRIFLFFSRHYGANGQGRTAESSDPSAVAVCLAVFTHPLRNLRRRTHDVNH